MAVAKPVSKNDAEYIYSVADKYGHVSFFTEKKYPRPQTVAELDIHLRELADIASDSALGHRNRVEALRRMSVLLGANYSYEILTGEAASLGEEAPASDLEYAISGGSMSITRYKGKSENVRIPEKIEGEPVTSFDNNVFKGYAWIKSVVIPAGVTKIGREAFSGCTGLKSIVIPDSVTTIDNSAFEGCAALDDIIIPDSVTNIGWFAFKGCAGLKSVELPYDLESIAPETFNGCTELTSVIIPSGLTSISRAAFIDCKSLASITIPCDIKQLDKDAFKNCTQLESIIYKGTVYTNWKKFHAYFEDGTCPGCGNKVSDGSTFCNKCGHKL